MIDVMYVVVDEQWLHRRETKAAAAHLCRITFPNYNLTNRDALKLFDRNYQLVLSPII